MASGNYTIGARIKIKDSKYTETISPKMKYTDGEPEYVPAQMSGNTNYKIYFSNMKVLGDDQGGTVATIAVVDARLPVNIKDETLVVSASIKPFISILWIGTLTLVLGFFISIFRRRKELNINPFRKGTTVKAENGNGDKTAAKTKNNNLKRNH